jgi:Tryptophan-rich Synechocystis species C-terminal domain
VWSVDSNGNYLSNLIGAVPGNSSALESFETIFNLDLNGDSTIGVPTTSQAAAANVAASSGSSPANLAGNSSADNFHFAGGSDSAASEWQGHQHNAMDHTVNSAQNGTTPMAGHDSFVFAPNSGPAGAASPPSWANTTPSSDSAGANTHAAWTATHDDAFGNAAVPDATHTAQWLAHHSDFHFV